MILFLVLVWHILFFILSIFLDENFFLKVEPEFNIKKYKLIVGIYEKILKIKKWKDKIPQYTYKNGFSKKHLVRNDLFYIKKFINETYRSEWYHFFCAFIIPFLFIFVKFKSAFYLSVLTFILNVPCILIQRYNRYRLRKILHISKKIKIKSKIVEKKQIKFQDLYEKI